MTKFTDALPAQSATPGLSHQKGLPQAKAEISVMLRRMHEDQRQLRIMLVNFVQTFYNGQAILDDLTSITTAATGDLLRFNGTKWVDYPDSNYQPQDAALDDLADISTAALGDLLRFDGSNWVDYPDSNFAASSHNHAGADINSGTLPDARIQASGVTQHEAALSIAGAQVDSGTLPDARIQESGVTQHQAALGLTAAQITSLTFADARIAESNVTQHEAAIDEIAASVVHGSSGPRVKNISGHIHMRNNADSGDVDMTAANVIATGNIQHGASGSLGFFATTPTTQATHVTDAVTAHALNATFDDTEVEAALDANGVKINAVLVVLERHGLMANA